jgi:hypothetical protein
MKRVGQHKTGIDLRNILEGESLEVKLERMLSNGEKIGAEVPIIHTERKNGVEPQYNIRTDRFEIALDGIGAIQKSYQTRREEKAKLEVVKNDEIEPIQGTN